MLRLVLAGVLVGLLLVPAAQAASPNEILRDCADDGVLQGDYSSGDLRRARRHIPTDVDQYTDCRDVLARATTEQAAGGSSGGSPGGSGGGGAGGGGDRPLLTPTDADRPQLDAARSKGPGALDVGGEQVVPGVAGFAAGAARNDLPATLIVLLALLALAAATAAAPRGRRLAFAVRDRVLRRG